jgi:hypothetical protein
MAQPWEDFKPDDAPAAAPQASTPAWESFGSEPDQGPGLAQRLVNAGNRGLAGLADFADPLAPLNRALRKAATAAGIDVGPDLNMSQQWERDGLISNDPSFAPKGNIERYAQSAATAAGQNLIPALFTLGGSSAAAVPGIIAGEGAASVGQGVGGQAARDEFPGNPYADLFGQVLGGLAGGIAIPGVKTAFSKSEITPLGTKLSPEEEGEFTHLLKTGTPEDITGFFKDKPGLTIDPEAVNQWVASRDAPGADASVHYKAADEVFGAKPDPVTAPAEDVVKPLGESPILKTPEPPVEPSVSPVEAPPEPVKEASVAEPASVEEAPPAASEEAPAEPLTELPAKVGNINTDKLGLTLEEHPYLAQAAKDINLDPQTHADTIAQAIEMKNEMSPEELVTFDPLKSEQVAHSVALRAQLNESVAAATKAAQDITNPATNTPEAQAAFDDAMNLAGLTANAVSEGSKFAGRLLNAHGIKVGPDGAYAKGIADLGANYTQDMRMELAEKVLYYKGDPEKLEQMMRRQAIKNNIVNALNVPRSLMSTLDLSAPFRQGFGLIHKKEFWNSFGSMFKQAWSEQNFKDVQNSIVRSDAYPLMKKAGLYIAKSNDSVTAREEAFMSSFAEKIPFGVGKLVRASDRAYTGFLNKLRADTFTSIISDAEKAGIDIAGNQKQLSDLGRFINNATGRGNLGKLENTAPLLSSLFFSPRLIASRVNTLNPSYYIHLDPLVRKEALKSLLAMGGIAATVLGLFKAGGASVETDPRSSDFAKIKDGNTRYDLTGGYSPYIRLATAFATNQKKTQSGDVQTLGAKFGSPDFFDVLSKFVRTKFAPIPGTALDLRLGKNVVGEDVTPSKAVVGMFTPMLLRDMADVYADQGSKGVAKAFTPDLFGVSVSTYSQHKKDKSVSQPWEHYK